MKTHLSGWSLCDKYLDLTCTGDLSTNHIGEDRRLRNACNCQWLHCSHTQRMDVDPDSNQKTWICQHGRYLEAYATSTKILCANEYKVSDIH